MLRALGYRVSALHVNHGLRGAESDADAALLPRALWAPRSSRAAGARPRRSCASSATPSRPDRLCAPPATRPPTRSRPSSTGSSRAARRAGSRRAARTASSGRCSRVRREETGPTAAATGSTYREDTTNAGHDARADPRARSCRCCAGCTRAPRRTCCALGGRAAAAPARARGGARRLLASTRRDEARPTSAAGSAPCASTTALRLEGTVRWGPWTLDGRTRRARGARAAARRPARRPDARRCRTCSWTRRCRGPSATRGRSSSADGEVVAVPGIVEAPGWDGAVTARREAMTELEHGVGEVLIDEERLRARIAELGAEISGRLRGPRPAARRRAQGRGLLHGRPDAPADGALRGRLHGDLELRRRDRLVGRRPDPQGPRHQHRGPRRARRRGHRRLGPDALVPDAEPRARASPPRSRSARC